jgi:hypothetical protein
MIHGLSTFSKILSLFLSSPDIHSTSFSQATILTKISSILADFSGTRIGLFGEAFYTCHDCRGWEGYDAKLRPCILSNLR